MSKMVISKEYANSVCEIKSMSNILISVGRVMEVTEKYIRISSGKNELRILNFHEEIKVNIFNATLGFKVIVGEVFTSTPGELAISDVSMLTDRERRNFFRVDMELEASVLYRHRGPVHELSAKVLDMSLSGLRVQVDHEFLEDDVISVALDLRTSKTAKKRPCVLPCRIVRVIENTERGELQYGCEFTGKQDESTEDALCSFLFVKQREFLNSRNKSLR